MPPSLVAPPLVVGDGILGHSLSQHLDVAGGVVRDAGQEIGLVMLGGDKNYLGKMGTIIVFCTIIGERRGDGRSQYNRYKEELYCGRNGRRQLSFDDIKDSSYNILST